MFQFRNSASSLILGCGLALAAFTSPGNASGFKVLYSFKGGSDGAIPTGITTKDAAHFRYGSTSYGGTYDNGTVYRIGPDGAETVLYSFQGGSADGEIPQSSLIEDNSGNLYGTTPYGGPANLGIVFKIAPDGTETVLHTFTGGSDGGFPFASLIIDKAGNLYGTTDLGGSSRCHGNGCGTVFELASDGSETVLHSFAGGTNDGAYPDAGLIEDKAGNLYGTGSFGGTNNLGVVFKVAPPAQGKKKWTETVLYSFAGGSDGAAPIASVIRDKAGNLYGTTYNGGGSSRCSNGCGTVFKLAPDDSETVLHAFAGGTRDGAGPQAGVVMDAAGNLYGTAYEDGRYGYGNVFRLAPDGTEKFLHSFTGGADGTDPDANLVMDKDGALIDTAAAGGGGNGGTVFRVKE